MHSFIHLPDYPVPICTECKYGMSVEGIYTHLAGKKHGNVPKEERRRIMEELSQIPGIIQNERDLDQFQFPPPTTKAIPALEKPKKDGISCKKCPYTIRQLQRMQEHCRTEHGWKNTRKRGREPYKKKQDRIEKKGEDLPWVSGVQCQRFFKQGMKSGWFEVERDEAPIAEEEDGQDMMSRVRRITQAGLDRVQKKTQERIKAMDESTEPNLWLRRVGWVRHLEGKDRPTLLASVQAIDGATEVTLQGIWESFERVVNTAQETIVSGVIGQAALFEVNRKEQGVKPRKPFDGWMEDETAKKYKTVWRQILCYLFRTQDWADEERPTYELTEEQGDAFDTLVEAVEELQELSQQRGAEGHASPEEEKRQERVDRLCLKLCIELLDHDLAQNEYESVVISGLAVMGMREDEGWLGAEDYTPKYSGFIKIARMLVVQKAYLEREDTVAMNKTFMDEKRARAQAEPVFDIVRRKVQRYMTLVTENSKPTPMDWIYESRSYGFKIRFTTAAEGVIDWVGDQISYQKIKFNMTQLQDMVHGLVAEAKRDLMRLMMIRTDGEGEFDAQQLPPMDLEKLEDDCSEDQVGWSFLKDIRNQWSVDGKWWLLGRVCQEDTLKKQWEKKGARDGEIAYRAEAVQEYQQLIHQFQEKLLMMFHIIGGQPPRAPEILGIRYCNTSNGGVRNIFIHKGMVCFVTAYHKNYRSSEQVKIIHRYLPREVGELLVRYLWLVLPFWQHVQVVVQEADEISPFVWMDAVVGRDKEKKDREDEDEEGGRERDSGEGPEVDEGYESGEKEFDFKTIHRSKKWTSDRLRGIIQEHSSKWLDEALNISAWRQMAIGIANQFLRGDFKDSGSGEIDLDAFDDDEDSPWDLQAGHGTHVAGMIYARLLRQERVSTMSRQTKFRQISQRWHRFLGFDSRVDGELKRKREDFEEEAREIQFQRFERLCRVNIRRKLKALMGEETQFRGIQEPTIHAIMTGKSPIVQITGTGGGKSLSFMLPAYCVPGGVTIVIAPLVSLKEDLQRRCEELKIDSTIWSARRPNRTTSVIIVTPESAISKGFSTFINRLQGTFKLDRVVVDECHTVLDSGPNFRPKMRELGSVLVRMCTQLVYLTATLPPRDEVEFFKAMHIPPKDVQMFRAATTRKNIQYQVQESGEESDVDAVCQLVTEKLEQYPAPGKIIVYSSRVTQAEELAEALDCPVYHRNVDSQIGKARRMREWLQGENRVIVATNALGLGVDIPDIRVVIHAGKPRMLRDYAQESGRAGRDGLPSEAIIVCSNKGKEAGQTRSWTNPMTLDMPEFINGQVCRRVIMDRVMDGRDDRIKCEEGEEVCDVCAEDRQMMEALEDAGWVPGEDEPFDDSGIAVGSSEVSTQGQEQVSFQGRYETNAHYNNHGGHQVSRQETIQLRAEFEEQEHGRQWQRTQLVTRKQQEAFEVSEFREQLEEWVGRCPVCHFQQAEEQLHRLEDCQHPELGEILGCVNSLVKGVKEGKRFEKFSCCHDCGVPQEICQKWEANGTGGYRRNNAIRCQYPGVVIPVVAVIWRVADEGKTRAINEWIRQDSVDIEEEEEVFKWFGRKIRWGGIEASKLCKVFYFLASIVK
jgi:RecQ family ATP-dependent DNA helicase